MPPVVCCICRQKRSESSAPTRLGLGLDMGVGVGGWSGVPQAWGIQSTVQGLVLIVWRVASSSHDA